MDGGITLSTGWRLDSVSRTDSATLVSADLITGPCTSPPNHTDFMLFGPFSKHLPEMPRAMSVHLWYYHLSC